MENIFIKNKLPIKHGHILSLCPFCHFVTNFLSLCPLPIMPILTWFSITVLNYGEIDIFTDFLDFNMQYNQTYQKFINKKSLRLVGLSPVFHFGISFIFCFCRSNENELIIRIYRLHTKSIFLVVYRLP